MAIKRARFIIALARGFILFPIKPVYNLTARNNVNCKTFDEQRKKSCHLQNALLAWWLLIAGTTHISSQLSLWSIALQSRIHMLWCWEVLHVMQYCSVNLWCFVMHASSSRYRYSMKGMYNYSLLLIHICYTAIIISPAKWVTAWLKWQERYDHDETPGSNDYSVSGNTSTTPSPARPRERLYITWSICADR